MTWKDGTIFFWVHRSSSPSILISPHNLTSSLRSTRDIGRRLHRHTARVHGHSHIGHGHRHKILFRKNFVLLLLGSALWGSINLHHIMQCQVSLQKNEEEKIIQWLETKECSTWQSINQSINQSIDRSIDPYTVNQSIKREVTASKDAMINSKMKQQNGNHKNKQDTKWEQKQTYCRIYWMQDSLILAPVGSGNRSIRALEENSAQKQGKPWGKSSESPNQKPQETTLLG